MADGGEHWVERVAGIRTWSRGGERAPHKPLLLLYALGRLQQAGRSEPITYADAEAPLSRLLTDFGPPHPTSPSYPFRRLANDGLWTLTTEGDQPADDQAGSLKKAHATGELAPDFAAALLGDPHLLARVARLLLDSQFPESLHQAIATQVGLDLEQVDLAPAVTLHERRRRSATFRDEILVAYEYRCAACGYEGRIGTEAIGLEAAHVRWWAAGGPDEVANGLALCSMHHLLLDRGVIGVTTDRTLTVSQHFVGRDPASSSLVLEVVGRDLAQPQPGRDPVADEHLEWHRREVFRGPARLAVAS